jgi:hypothetical protein
VRAYLRLPRQRAAAGGNVEEAEGEFLYSSKTFFFLFFLVSCVIETLR